MLKYFYLCDNSCTTKLYEDQIIIFPKCVLNTNRFQVCTLEKRSELINAHIFPNIVNHITKMTSSVGLQHITMFGVLLKVNF